MTVTERCADESEAASCKAQAEADAAAGKAVCSSLLAG